MITKQNMMTVGALGFAAFAAWFVLRGPGRAAIAPTAGQKRAGEVQGFMDQLTMQGNNITNQAGGFYVAPLPLN